ncbi:MAG: hypothetical protein AAB876_02115, partial [Patescibacteria group bacterium]
MEGFDLVGAEAERKGLGEAWSWGGELLAGRRRSGRRLRGSGGRETAGGLGSGGRAGARGRLGDDSASPATSTSSASA